MALRIGDGRSRRLGLRRPRVWLVAASAAVTLGVAVLFFRYLFLGNFAVVDPGKVYRSAQPTGDLGWLARYHVRSVLNLRGGSPADLWYAEEVRACAREGIDFYDLPMIATRRPSRAELRVLLDLLDRCRYPLLIHCKSGSDRTGLVSALYRLSVLGELPEQAAGAFSVWRGHVAFGGPQLLQEPFKEYAAWLQERQLAHSPQRFRQWVEQDYRCDARANDPDLPLLPGPRPQFAAEARARQ